MAARAGRRQAARLSPGRYPAAVSRTARRGVPPCASSVKFPDRMRRHAVAYRRTSSSCPPQPAMTARTTSCRGSSSLPSAAHNVEAATRCPLRAAIARNDGSPAHATEAAERRDEVARRPAGKRVRPQVVPSGVAMRPGGRSGGPRGGEVLRERGDRRLHPGEGITLGDHHHGRAAAFGECLPDSGDGRGRRASSRAASAVSRSASSSTAAVLAARPARSA